MKHCRRITSLIILNLIFVVLGCTKPHVMIDRAIVLNATATKITDVKVVHEPTKQTGQVNAILPQMTLEIGFSGQPMLARQATVSWRDCAGVNRQVTLDLPYDFNAAKEGQTMNLIYEIHSPGTVITHLDKAK